MRRCPPSGRKAQFAPRMLRRSSPSQAIAVNAAAMTSAAAVHIRCRYALTTATDAGADADVLPARIRVRRPRRGRQTARPHCSPHPNATASTWPLSRREAALMCNTGWATRIPQDARRQEARLRGLPGQQAVHQHRQCRRQLRAALTPMDYPNRRRLKICAYAELRELKDDIDLARRVASPGHKAKIERAVLLRLELHAVHHAALHRARVGASARAGQVAQPKPGKRGEGAPCLVSAASSGAAEDDVLDR